MRVAGRLLRLHRFTKALAPALCANGGCESIQACVHAPADHLVPNARIYFLGECWTAYVDVKTKRTFYYNADTMTSQWTKPAVLLQKEVSKHMLNFATMSTNSKNKTCTLSGSS